MAKKPGGQTKRKRTLESLENALKKNNLTEEFINDKVDEYMFFYDRLCYVNQRLMAMEKLETCSLKEYMEATREARQISTRMCAILTFLGLKPIDVSLTQGGEDEEL